MKTYNHLTSVCMEETLQAICKAINFVPNHNEFSGDDLEEKIKDLVKHNKELEKENKYLKDKIHYYSYCTWNGILALNERDGAGDEVKKEFCELCKELNIMPYSNMSV